MGTIKMPASALETVSRRTVLEWLGKATVLTLGGSVIAACTRSGMASVDAAIDSDGLDTNTSLDIDAEAVTDGGTDVPGEVVNSCEGFPFQPAQPEGHEVYASWGERTVDPQDLSEILSNWTLRVDGMVEEPRTFTFADVVDLARQEQVTDFHCVEGWSVYDVPWSGVHLSTIFAAVRPTSAATHVTFHTLGNRYNESLPLPVALEPRTLLAYGIAGCTIPFKHGFPLRIVIPRLLAYKSAKFVTRLELTDGPVEGFWVQHGYPYDGEVPPGRLRDGKY